MLEGKSGPLCAASSPLHSSSGRSLRAPPLRNHLSSPQIPGRASGSRVRVAAGAGAGTAHRWRQKGAGNPTKLPERVSAGTPRAFPAAVCARRPLDGGPSRSARREPPREAGGCGARPGLRGAAGAREEREAPPRCGRRPPRAAPCARGALSPVGRAAPAPPGRAPGVPGGARPAAKARPPREPRAPRRRRRRRQRGRQRPLQPAGVRGAGGGGARGGVAAGGRAGVRAGPAPPSVPPRLRCPASSRLRHRHTPTKHPPPCVRPGWRAELSPARFLLFDPSPLWLGGGGGGGRGMGARVGKGVKIDEDDGSF